jgi:D-alanyl-D-alanine carboxypeptidase
VRHSWPVAETRTTLLAGLLVLVSAAPASGSTHATGAVRKAMRGLVHTGVPGVVVHLQRGNQATTLREGVSEVRSARPFAVRDRFRIASETKMFTAAVVLRLVQAGRLGVEDAVERWLPGMVPGGDQITVRELLGMRSGLPDYLNVDLRGVFARLRNPRFAWTPQQLIRIGLSRPAEFPPGEGYSYSNTNYLLLELIIEKATGQSYATELRQEILRPLQLRDSVYPSMTDRDMPAPSSHGYQLGDGPRRDVTATSPSIAGAAGALISTPADVARFLRALNAGRIIGPDLLAQMRTPSDQSNGVYGLGLAHVNAPGCGASWGHTGEILGFQSFAVATTDGTVSGAMDLNASGSLMTDLELPSRQVKAKNRLGRAIACWVSPQ